MSQIANILIIVTLNLTDYEISKNHKWNRKTAPVCGKKFTTYDILSTDGSILQTIVVAPQGETIYDDSTISFDGYWIYYAISDSNNKKLIYCKVNTDGTNIIKTSEFTF